MCIYRSRRKVTEKHRWIEVQSPTKVRSVTMRKTGTKQRNDETTSQKAFQVLAISSSSCSPFGSLHSRELGVLQVLHPLLAIQSFISESNLSFVRASGWKQYIIQNGMTKRWTSSRRVENFHDKFKKDDEVHIIMEDATIWQRLRSGLVSVIAPLLNICLREFATTTLFVWTLQCLSQQWRRRRQAKLIPKKRNEFLQ